MRSLDFETRDGSQKKIKKGRSLFGTVQDLFSYDLKQLLPLTLGFYYLHKARKEGEPTVLGEDGMSPTDYFTYQICTTAITGSVAGALLYHFIF